MRGWDLWTHSTPIGIAWILACELGVGIWAAVACVEAFRDGPPDGTTWLAFATLVVATGTHVFFTKISEERRRVARLSTEYIDHTGIWTCSAAVVLPAHLLLILMLGIRLQRYYVAHKPPVRVLFGTTAIAASGLATNTIAVATPIKEWIADPSQATVATYGHFELTMAFLAAAAAYFLAQTIVVGVARGIRLSWSWQDTIGTVKENADFVAIICLGMMAAILIFVGAGLVVLLVIVAVFWTRNAKELTNAVLDARHDALTELLNRRGFDESAQLLLDVEPHNVALMLDLDWFKKINDEHGHPNGDAVLRAFAETLRSQTRGRDLLCRKGGEEVMALLPDTSTEEALVVAERMRHAVEDMQVPATRPAGGAPYMIDGLSVSIGMAVHPHHGRTLAELEEAADRALYSAKNSGRNCVCVASVAGTPPPKPVELPAQRLARRPAPSKTRR